MVSVQKTDNEQALETVFQIRQKVFVEEQNVPHEEEYDEFENIAAHYLASYNGEPAGVARWRETDKGVKLERFAVLENFRNKAVGSHILKRVLQDVKEAHPGKTVYLHAQFRAIPFYERHGFQKVGDQFTECEIEHFKMVLQA
ncbi:GNAT family N-acetyltransferase [Adhaeribacter sp. BT258]|uniref:GNAT family N-acetyltransferase n=1 Tax=Adhaeribacter terrigena TaxID=2793070 RepID=A0ABS1BYM7_9BACT|nr:GNAT family N-acetyltransferase [Adhaeribacter terrigena]MBK0402179.1 GNAT family N-acetyltransferase [Adhaeribacter terrigena]